MFRWFSIQVSKKNNALQRWISLHFRKLLSGAPDGTPPWLEAVARGEGAGYFFPTDAPWVVHRDFGTLVGGIRALLMQALHPGPLAGVRDHSRYAKDPLGRLSGTIRWLTVTTFASTEEVLREAGRVNRLHDSVRGDYVERGGARQYSATDERLLLWVHVAFMESFLVAHQMYARAEIPKGEFESGAENYVAQWARAAEPLGLSSAPTTLREMHAIIDDALADGTLRVDDQTREVVSFIANPPLPKVVMPVYRLLFSAAVASLRDDIREFLGFKRPSRFVIPTTRAVLRIMRVAVGPESPIEDAALERIAASIDAEKTSHRLNKDAEVTSVNDPTH